MAAVCADACRADVARFPPSKVAPVVPPLDAFRTYEMVHHSFTEPGSMGAGVPPPRAEEQWGD